MVIESLDLVYVATTLITNLVGGDTHGDKSNGDYGEVVIVGEDGI